jgi:hypothetical protein
VGLQISFLPGGEPEGDTWKLRLPPGPERGLIPGLDAAGEIAGLGEPDFAELDRRMVERRAGYQRRVLATGVVEVSATGQRAKGVVLDWLSDMLSRRLP